MPFRTAPVARPFTFAIVAAQLERDTLAACCGHPFVVSMESAFQTRESLCVVLEFLGGGFKPEPTIFCPTSAPRGIDVQLSAMTRGAFTYAVTMHPMC